MKQELHSDVWIFRLVVLILGMSALASLAGAIILASQDRPTPELLVALGSAAIGGLAGLLAPSPFHR